MKAQDAVVKRIQYFCKKKNMSYYELSYKSAVPMTTLMHILDFSTKNPGIFTIIKICNGLNITIKDFFDTEDFQEIEYDTE